LNAAASRTFGKNQIDSLQRIRRRTQTVPPRQAYQVSVMETYESDSCSAQATSSEDRPARTLFDALKPNLPAAADTGEMNASAALLADALTPTPDAARNLQPPIDPHAVWQQLLGEFALEMPSNQLDAWIQASQVLHYEDGHFIVGLPNAYYLDWAQDRLRPHIKRKLASIMRRNSIDISFRVVTPPAPARKEPLIKPAPLYEMPTANAATSRRTPPAASMPATTPVAHSAPGTRGVGTLNSKYTFESFVVGKHNRIAFAAAEDIARSPGQRFNPLYIYGGVGLGKTHLLNAIANRLIERGFSVLYCSTEQFTNDLVSAIRDRATDAFRSKYREIDVLLLDDIQFIVGKESTQEELFHTFNDLHAAGKQVIFTSDCPPRELPGLEDRLRSRFEGGLSTDVVAPDFETRVAILQTKVERQGMQVPYDVLMLIADRVKSNVRELEGALNKVWLYAQSHDQAIDLSLAELVIGSLTPRRTVCPPGRTVERVATYHGMTVADLTGRRRTADVARARQIAMYLLREENALSLPAIGEHLGGRDHSTVSHGVEKITSDMQSDEMLRQIITRLRAALYLP
jgi:chromosomal replication initiator protein